MKKCNKCMIDKELDMFRFRKDKLIYSGNCKKCESLISMERRKLAIKDSERANKYIESSARYYEKNKEKIKEKRAEYYKNKMSTDSDFVLKKNELDKIYRMNNVDKIEQYRKNNATKLSEKKKMYYQKNKESIKKKVSDYYKLNRHIDNSNKSKRRANKKQATPKWLTNEHFNSIRQLYKKAKLMQLETGIIHHVDHIIPLNSPNVCGLHVPWNLQILTAEENLKKGNRFNNG